VTDFGRGLKDLDEVSQRAGEAFETDLPSQLARLPNGRKQQINSRRPHNKLLGERLNRLPYEAASEPHDAASRAACTCCLPAPGPLWASDSSSRGPAIRSCRRTCSRTANGTPQTPEATVLDPHVGLVHDGHALGQACVHVVKRSARPCRPKSAAPPGCCRAGQDAQGSFFLAGIAGTWEPAVNTHGELPRALLDESCGPNRETSPEAGHPVPSSIEPSGLSRLGRTFPLGGPQPARRDQRS
jgi:hypothetical protein